ncbi:MAG: hypothetical protein FWG29_10840, partial [Treponema sp.]|nr:hypothetical protein [Treponema sp.]
MQHSNDRQENIPDGVSQCVSPYTAKTLGLLEFDRIKDTVANCALSAEAARIIREEIPLFDPAKVRIRKKLVSSFC